MRRRTVLTCCILILFSLLLDGCRKEINEYYERPDWLEPTIYKHLEKRGNFTSYLSCVDKAGYRDVLGRAGFFTVFAPTDEAFSTFIAEKGYASAKDIDTLTATKIVKYSIVYNQYTRDKIDDYQSTAVQGWVPDKAFKRQTAYYKWVYEEDINDNPTRVFDQNGVPQLPESAPVFNVEDNNNKHIPFFTGPFFALNNLTSYDYNYFFPGTEYTGFNVADARVTEADILCENGIVHATDKVVLPLANIEEILASDPQYSEFKKVLDQYVLEYDLAPPSFLDRYEQVAGRRENVYIKTYPLLVFAPNCENYMKFGGGETYDAQTDGWTIFAPNNDAVTGFFNSKFLVYYKKLDNMSPQIISEFINAHMFRTTVWPSKFTTTLNYFGEPARFDPENDIMKKEFGSNGVFYGTNKVQATDAFYTVLGEIILNPNYSMMLQALNTTELYYVVKNPALHLTVFMINNTTFTNIGLTYDVGRNSWVLDNPDLGNNAGVALNRLINMHIVLNEDMSNLSSNSIVETFGGEYIRYNAGYIWGAGNAESGESIIPTTKTPATNGLSYRVGKALRFSINNIGRHIEGVAAFSAFHNYLQKSAASMPDYVYNVDTKVITNVANTTNHTLLIPNNTAIQAAVTDGLLPVIDASDFTQEQHDMVLKFVMYHIMPKVIVVPNGKLSGQIETLFKTDDGKTYLTVLNEPGNMTIIDGNGRTANVVMANSNVLSNRAVIHQLDNYLKIPAK